VHDRQRSLNINLKQNPTSFGQSGVNCFPQSPVPVASPKYLFAFQERIGGTQSLELVMRYKPVVATIHFASPRRSSGHRYAHLDRQWTVGKQLTQHSAFAGP
jgi:hypothetical protein